MDIEKSVVESKISGTLNTRRGRQELQLKECMEKPYGRSDNVPESRDKIFES